MRSKEVEMKLAVIGSRKINCLELSEIIPGDVDEIVSGGADGIDRLAEEFAKSRGIKFTVFLPEYDKYGRAAPIVRNKKIVEYADEVYSFWNGNSKGTKFVIDYCKKINKKCRIIMID